MKFYRSKLWILLLVLALTASIGACGYRPEPEKTESGQTVFRLGFSETPSSLDPYTAETDAAAAAISLLYDTLFYADIETGRYINSVCQEYTVQPAAADGARLWTLTLRNDVYFHDGTALTARDVEFSLQSMKDFSLLYGYPGCELIDTTGISVTDDTHLSFLAWGDVAAVEECLSRVPIVPKSVWNTLPGMEYTTSGIPKDASQAKKSLAALVLTPETMTGSGLYIWDKYENGVLTLRRSEDYWNGTARAEIVELHFGCDDLAAALENNAIDAAWNLSRAAAEELAEGRSTAYGTSGELLRVEFNQRTDDTSGGNACFSIRPSARLSHSAPTGRRLRSPASAVRCLLTDFPFLTGRKAPLPRYAARRVPRRFLKAPDTRTRTATACANRRKGRAFPSAFCAAIPQPRGCARPIS